MTVINPKSISGITSITTPAGSDNLFTVHTNNQTERLRITSAGDVGIGIDTPSEILHIRKNDATGPTITLQNNANKAYINNWGSTGGGSGRENRFEINATSQTQASICAPYITFMTGGTGDSNEKLRIDSSGRVGINTTAFLSGEMLSIRGGANDSSEFNFHTYADFKGGTDAWEGYTAIFRGATAANANNQWTGIGAKTSYGWIDFANNSASRITMTSSNVGIGTDNPQQTLQVEDSSEATVSLYNAGTKKAALQVQSNFGTILYSYDNEPLIFSTNSGNGFNEKMRITGIGSVGIGITNPAEKFQVNGGNIAITGGTAYKIDTHPLVSYASFTAISGGSYAARLGSTGTSTIRSTQIYGGGSHIATFDGVNKRLGINTTAPNEDLEVKGDQTATIFINAGQHDASTAQEATLKLGFNQSHANDSIGYVKLIEGGGNAFDGDLTFGVPYNNSGTPTTREALRIKWNGKIGIGTDSVGGKLDIHSSSAGSVNPDGDADELVLESSDKTGMSILSPGSGESSIYFGNPGTNGQKEAWLKYYHETHSNNAKQRALQIKAGGGEVAYFNSTGLVMSNDKGLSFINADDIATGETVNSSVITDYEEGTWTPTNSIGLTLTVNNTAHYIKVGRLVTVWFDVSLKGNPDSAQCSAIQSLPYVSEDSDNFYGQSNSIWYSNTNDAKRDHDDDNTLFFVDKDSATLKIWNVTSGHLRVRSWAAHSSTQGRRFRGTISYRSKY